MAFVSTFSLGVSSLGAPAGLPCPCLWLCLVAAFCHRASALSPVSGHLLLTSVPLSTTALRASWETPAPHQLSFTHCTLFLFSVVFQRGGEWRSYSICQLLGTCGCISSAPVDLFVLETCESMSNPTFNHKGEVLLSPAFSYL